ncbi:MAG: hypothetical protein J2P36_18345, partial [Ktedonobacteraceae bacterium]|nr:hypothetical protein [Ktedonobacteraceae bacterium]
LGGAWGRTSGVNTLVLMPDGLIHFAGEDSYTIIGYKMIKHIRFDSPSDGKHKGVLVFDPLPRTGNPEIDRLHYDGSFGIDGYNEAPHLIARRVQDDYTRFQARNHLP